MIQSVLLESNQWIFLECRYIYHECAVYIGCARPGANPGGQKEKIPVSKGFDILQKMKTWTLVFMI